LGRLAFDGEQQFALHHTTVKERTSPFVARSLRDRIRRLKPGEGLRVAAHSQGVAVFAAAGRFLNDAERAHIDFVAFGQAIPVLPSGLRSVTRYINVVDPVPILFGGGIVGPALDSIFRGHVVKFRMFFHGGMHPVAEYIDEERALSTTPKVKPPQDWVRLYNEAMARTYGK
jgi:hypothetical protein